MSASRYLIPVVLIWVCTASIIYAQSIGTSFLYQGSLQDSNLPADDFYDFEVSLYTGAGGGTSLGTLQLTDVRVIKGIFTLALDFGEGVFEGGQRWLEIGIRLSTDTGAYTILSPRQYVYPVPRALSIPGIRTIQDNDSPCIIGGSPANRVTASVLGATISGGGKYSFPNRVTDDYGTVGGGINNLAGDIYGTTTDAKYATVGGGSGNQATEIYSTIGGGNNNRVTYDQGTVGGGLDNEAGGGFGATVGGGQSNRAMEWITTVSGGRDNIADGEGAMVPGGLHNTASGNYSMAAGQRAKALHNGSFIWADSQPLDFQSYNDNEFRVRATGGVAIFSGVNPSTGVNLAAGSGSWSMISDRAVKENFEFVDGREILECVATLPIESWNYIAQGDDIRHVGPMAQDFYTAFCVGSGESTIDTVDASGVALAAIQGLYHRVQDQDREINELKARLMDLERKMNKNQTDDEIK